MPISIIDNFQINAPKNIDQRLGPYATIEEATGSIQLLFRHVGMTVTLTGSGAPIDYWFNPTTADSDLRIKPTGFPYSGSATITGSLLVSGSGITITGSLNADSITGSLLGTATTASYVKLTEGPGIKVNGLEITASVRKVNGASPDAITGNVAVSLAATYTGFSSSLDGQTPSLQASSSGDITASFSNGTLWIVTGETDITRTGSNGETYIFTSGSVGQWVFVPNYSQNAADVRYVLKSGDTMTGNLSVGSNDMTAKNFYGTASYVAGNIFTGSNSATSASYAITSSYALSASYAETASYVKNSNITYTSQSTETFNLANLEVLDYSNDVAVLYDNATSKLKFIFGTPQSSSITAFTFNNTFATDRFDQQGDEYSVTGSWSNGAYTLISASLYTGSVSIFSLVNSGTVISQSFTGDTTYTTGSQQFRLEITSSNPLSPTPYYITSSILTGTISKTNPGAPSITPSVTVQLGLSSTNMEENATGSITYTTAYNATSNQWIQNGLASTASFGTTIVPLGSTAGGFTFFVTGSATGSTAIRSNVTASYTVPSASWTAAGQSTNIQRTAGTTYNKIISIRSGSCLDTGSATTFSTGSMYNLRNWDVSLGSADYDITGSIQLGTSTATQINNKQVSITWSGNRYLYIIVSSSVSITQIQQLSTPSNAFTHIGTGTTPTTFKIGNYNVYRTFLKQAGGGGTTTTYTLIAS